VLFIVLVRILYKVLFIQFKIQAQPVESLSLDSPGLLLQWVCSTEKQTQIRFLIRCS